MSKLNGQVQPKPVKRLCKVHNIITVNGQFPGPTLAVRDGDSLVIKVVNAARYNVSLHWYYANFLATKIESFKNNLTNLMFQ